MKCETQISEKFNGKNGDKQKKTEELRNMYQLLIKYILIIQYSVYIYYNWNNQSYPIVVTSETVKILVIGFFLVN